MHVLQYIAVKADSPEEAIDNVRMELESMLGNDGSTTSWYDWFVTGGGRWNIAEGDDFKEAYVDGKTNMIVSSENLAEFHERINTCIANRLAEFNRYRDEWNRSGVDLVEKLDSYTGNMQYHFDLYPLGKMIDMVQGEWDYNSYFYDLTNWSTNPEHMLKNINDVGGVWYLVPVDFHF